MKNHLHTYVMVNLLLGMLLAFHHAKASADSSSVILIYSRTNTYLLPIIEEKLINLYHVKEKDKLFKKVINLTRIEDNYNEMLKYIEYSRNLRNQNVIKGLDYTNRTKEVNDSLSQLLTNVDLYLQVKENVLDKYIEYQISVYKTAKSIFTNFSTGNTSNIRLLPGAILDKDYTTTTFFIDPAKDDYINIIDNALKKLFPSTNFRPEAKITLINYHNLADSLINIAIGDSIHFDASNSFDLDSPPEQLTFKWRLLQSSLSNQITPNIGIPFNSTLPKQIIHFNRIGRYELGLTVYDGISYSSEVKIIIIVEDKPKIFSDRAMFSFIKQVSIFNYNKSTVLKGGFFVSTNDTLATLVARNTLDTSNTKNVSSLEKITSTLRKELGGKLTNKFTHQYTENQIYELNNTPFKITSQKISNGYEVKFIGNAMPGVYGIYLFGKKKYIQTVSKNVVVKYLAKAPISVGLSMDVTLYYYNRYFYSYEGAGSVSSTSHSELYRTIFVPLSLLDIRLYLSKSISIDLSPFHANNVYRASYNNYNLQDIPSYSTTTVLSNNPQLGVVKQEHKVSSLGKYALNFNAIPNNPSLALNLSLIAQFVEQKIENPSITDPSNDYINFPMLGAGVSIQKSLHDYGTPFNVELGYSMLFWNYDLSSSYFLSSINQLEKNLLIKIGINFQPFIKNRRKFE